MGAFHFSPRCSMAYSFLLPIHSITMNTSRRIATVPTLGKSEKAGILNNEGENISEIYEKACCIFSARKNIHANTVSPKVERICINSLKEGKIRPSATTPRFTLFLLVNKSGRK